LIFDKETDMRYPTRRDFDRVEMILIRVVVIILTLITVAKVIVHDLRPLF
jgi:hypothetical protein